MPPPAPQPHHPRSPRPNAPRKQAAGSQSASPFRHSFGSLIARWDDPLTWSLSLFSWRGYRVGLHWFTFFWACALTILAFMLDRIGPQHVVLGLSWVLVIMFCRELTRLSVAARVGGEGEYVPLWPLGAMIGPTLPRAAGARILLVATPSVVSIILGVTLAAGVLALGGGSSLLFFNPFDPQAPARQLSTHPLQIVWWGYYANFVLAGLNLLPMLPLDGGRAIEAISYPRGLATSRRRVGLLGLFVAGLLLVVGTVAEQMVLVCVGLFGGLTSWLELRRAEFIANPISTVTPSLPAAWLEEHDDAAHDPHPHLRHDAIDARLAADISESETPPPMITRHEASSRQPNQPHPELDSPQESPADAELDQVLAKISRSGRASLTPDELEILRKATERLKNDEP